MKQKLPRVLFIKTENASVPNTPAQRRKRILPEGVFRKRFENNRNLTGRSHPSGLRQRAAAIAGGDPRRCRGIGGYLRAQGAIPRRLVVVVVTGEHHVDGGSCSGGRRFGRGWSSPERAASIELRWGLEY